MAKPCLATKPLSLTHNGTQTNAESLCRSFFLCSPISLTSSLSFPWLSLSGSEFCSLPNLELFFLFCCCGFLELLIIFYNGTRIIQFLCVTPSHCDVRRQTALERSRQRSHETKTMHNIVTAQARNIFRSIYHSPSKD
jgi:hypothetical protein